MRANFLRCARKKIRALQMPEPRADMSDMRIERAPLRFLVSGFERLGTSLSPSPFLRLCVLMSFPRATAQDLSITSVPP
jgi:hypothetical protein